MVQVAIIVLILCRGPINGDEKATEKDRPNSNPKAREAVAKVEVVRSFRERVGTGSGFFISRKGQLLTNWHVVCDAAKITVRTARGETLIGTVIAEDRERDLAIVQVRGDNFPSLELVDNDHTGAGIPITLIGGGNFPTCEGHTGAMREIFGQPMLLISTSLQPGYSGSPLVDAQERVVGIANGCYVGKTPEQNENFAVPVVSIRKLLAQVLAGATQ